MTLLPPFLVLASDEVYSVLVVATASTAVLMPILGVQRVLPITAYLVFGYVPPQRYTRKNPMADDGSKVHRVLAVLHAVSHLARLSQIPPVRSRTASFSTYADQS